MNNNYNQTTDVSEHISFEEMSEFVLADSLTPEFLELAAKVNRHIVKCGECRKLHESMMTASEKIEALSSAGEKAEVLRDVMDSIIPETPGVVKRLAAKIRFGISGLSEIIDFGGGFSHPCLSFAMKSASEEISDEGDVSEIKSSIADDSGTRITASAEGTLTVCADSAKYPEGSVAVLILHDEEGTLRAEFKKLSDSKNAAVFEDIGEGSYTLELEAPADE